MEEKKAAYWLDADSLELQVLFADCSGRYTSPAGLLVSVELVGFLTGVRGRVGG